MSAKRFSRLQKATTIVPLALLSAAWTASLAGVGVNPVSSASGSNGSQSDGPTVPDEAIEAPASVSSPVDRASSGFTGNSDQIVATSSTNGIPSAALAAYQRAETVINSADPSCNLTWQLIAAIGRVESNHGRFGGNALDDQGIARPGIYGPALNGNKGTSLISDTDAGQFDNDMRFDHAVGPMQFIPSTWSVVGVDADNDGQRNPQDIDDAALGTAVYLCSGSGDLSTLGGQRSAVLRYNHSQSYVDLVLSVMDNYLAGDFMTVPNSTTAAGYLSPLPPAANPGNGGKQRHAGADHADQADPPTPSASPEADDDPAPTPAEGANDNPGGQPRDGGDDNGSAPHLPIPSITVPAIPHTSQGPVDDVLTTSQAIVQCTLDGFVDDPLSLTDDFDACVEDYTTKG